MGDNHVQPFRPLRDLGEEKFRKILNHLMLGKPAVQTARMIQGPPPEGWGQLLKVSENALVQQLTKLRHMAAEKAFGEEIAQEMAAGMPAPQMKRLERLDVKALEVMEHVAKRQLTRMETLFAQEQATKKYIPSINKVVHSLRMVLLDVQKMRFDLGVDEFKGPVGQSMMKGAVVTTSLPDGTNIQKQVFEAISIIDQVFDQRKIPKTVFSSES